MPWDVDVTGHAYFVPLEASADEWADVVLATDRETNGSSNRTVAEIYDMKKISKELQQVYLG